MIPHCLICLLSEHPENSVHEYAIFEHSWLLTKLKLKIVNNTINIIKILYFILFFIEMCFINFNIYGLYLTIEKYN